MGKGYKTGIGIGDVQQKRITAAEAIERIARAVDGNADGITAACKKTKEHDVVLHGNPDSGEGGLIEDVAVNRQMGRTNRSLFLVFVAVLVVELTLILLGVAIA